MMMVWGMMWLFPLTMGAINRLDYVSTTASAGDFPLIVNGVPAAIVASQDDEAGVKRVVGLLQNDVAMVAGQKPELMWDKTGNHTHVILAGTLGSNPMIDRLVAEGKLDGAMLRGKWEAYVVQVVPQPMPGVEQALVIAGSDKRGTIFGIFDLSAQMGVSPWYFWADVPVVAQRNLYVKPGVHTMGEPSVKYRGIFINDEAPALAGWAHKYHGGFTHTFYEKVFELILRLKGNYLWPAMWGRSLFDDDPLNAPLAHEMGVVIGTSHHEPMMRAHDEWRRYGSGKWDYTTNAPALERFWRDGLTRMGNHESLVTIGMRGDGDEPMTEGTAIDLLENIVASQRNIIEELTGQAAAQTPQVWALYKEVQDYYDHGMRVPDDVTLLLCDDNWGNLRKLPQPGEAKRAGGYGIYYHYDYVGGPRNYKWINTNQISRVWEQMHMAWEHGVDRLWIINVGDIKPMEFPTEFFLDYAWNPDAITAAMLPDYTRRWARQYFGGHHTDDIARIVDDYSRFNSRRKPELLDWTTYSLVNYREFERVVEDYNQLAALATKVGEQMPAAYKDAYFQLVWYPAVASATINELYLRVAQNHLFARQGRSTTNAMAKAAFELFNRDAELSRQYNEDLAGGKWSHMMDQTRIGYTYWQQPDSNRMPDVKTIELPNEVLLGVAVDGSDQCWPVDVTTLRLPAFYTSYPQKHYIDVFNRGSRDAMYFIKNKAPWVKLSQTQGEVGDGVRVWVEIDPARVPKKGGVTTLDISGPQGQQTTVTVEAIQSLPAIPADFKGAVQVNGYAAMEAEQFTRKTETPGMRWEVVPGLGRTLSGVTPQPSTLPSQKAALANNAALHYDVWMHEAGDVEVHAYVSPTLDYLSRGGIRYAVSVDGGAPVEAVIHPLKSEREWEKAVADNIVVTTTRHRIAKPGKHTVTIHLIDPGVVLQKVVMASRPLPQLYLGPDATVRGK